MADLHKNLTRIAVVVLLVSLLASFFVAGKRMTAEASYRQANIAVDMNDVTAFAHARGKAPGDVLQEMKDRGVTQVLFKEMSMGSLEISGSLEVVQGARLMQSPDYPALADAIAVSPAELYILIKDPGLADQVEAHVLAKVPGSKAYDTEPKVLGVPTMVPSSAQEAAIAKAGLLDVGMGFDLEGIQLAHETGLGIIPQIRSWTPVDAASVKILEADLRAMPSISLLMFNDKQVPGYPDEMDILQEVLLDEEGLPYAPLTTIEFNDQKGLVGLATEFEKKVVRLHTISNPEMSRFEGEGTREDLEKGLVQALDRWELAADERNIRCFLVRFFDIDKPYETYAFNLDYLESLAQGLEAKGYDVTSEAPLLDPVEVPLGVTALVGLGVVAGLVILMVSLGMPRLGLLGGGAGSLAWLGLLLVMPAMGLKLMALAAVIVFPTLSCILFLDKEKVALGPALVRFLAMCGLSFLGAVLMVGLLSETSFMLKLDQFVGVKLAHAIPVLAVPFILYIGKSPQPKAALQSLWRKTIDYRWALIFAVLGIALVIYLGRTGNESTQVTDFELAFRQFLADTLLVRPRSKEFLIGYPAALLFLTTFARQRGAWFMTLPVVIGQVSLVNTYAHIHTPLAASLLRTANGLWLGILIGILVVVVFRLFLPRWQKAFPPGGGQAGDDEGGSHV